MKTIIAIAATTLAMLASSHAAAQTDAVTTSVSYADLDLSRPNGRDVLERRVDQAVSKVCGDEPSMHELKRTSMYRNCREEAWAVARQKLAAVYSGTHFAQAAITVGPGKP